MKKNKTVKHNGKLTSYALLTAGVQGAAVKASKKELYKNNCIAAANGYIGGLTVEWMASYADVSKRTMYNHIRRGQDFLLELHPQYKKF